MSENNIQGAVLVKLKEKEHKRNAKTLEDVLLVAVRIRGAVNKTHYIKKTLELLRLHKKNHAILIKATKPVNGMLFKVKDFIAYGMINKELLVKLLQKRARLQGRNALTINDIKKLTGINSFEDLANALMKFDLKYQDIKHIVPVFRLHPARGGFFKGIKKPYSLGGVLGFHGNDINRLIKRMI